MNRSSSRRRRPPGLLLLATVVAVGATLAASAGSAAATPSALQRLAVERLGAPDHAGYAVSDAAAVRRQLAAATGNQFSPLTTRTATVVLPRHGGIRRITFRETRTVRGGPFLEIVQASVKAGPWSASADRSSFFLSYAVDSVARSSIGLRQAGFDLVALDGTRAAFWAGKGGVLIRLIEADAAPATSGANTTQAPLDLGPARALTLIPCDPGGVRTQLAQALQDLQWLPPSLFPLPYEFSDGTSRVLDVTVNIAAGVGTAAAGGPFVAVESPVNAPAQYDCTPTQPHVHPVWLSTNVPAAAQQVQNAGMDWISRVPGLISLHRGTGGIFIEVADASFLSAAG